MFSMQSSTKCTPKLEWQHLPHLQSPLSLLPYSKVTLRTMLSFKCQTQPYQVKCLVGVLETQQHVLQDRQSPLPHNGVQQLGEDLVEEKKKSK